MAISQDPTAPATGASAEAEPTGTEATPTGTEATGAVETAPAGSTSEGAPYGTASTKTATGTETPTGLRVRVDFRAGQVELPLAELLALSEGQVLPRLDGVVFPRVEAVSAGRVFAEGELVEVEGRVGFRVTKLLR